MTYTITAERCREYGPTEKWKNEWMENVRVKTESWRREQTFVVPCRGRLVMYIDGRLWQSKSQSDRPIIREWWESAKRTSDSEWGCGAGGETERRERAHNMAEWLQRRAAPLDKLRIPSRHGTMAEVCGIVVTLHRQTNGCRSRAAVGSTSSATAGYWLLRVCSRNSWLGLFRLHLRFRNVLQLIHLHLQVDSKGTHNAFISLKLRRILDKHTVVKI